MTPQERAAAILAVQVVKALNLYMCPENVEAALRMVKRIRRAALLEALALMDECEGDWSYLQNRLTELAQEG